MNLSPVARVFRFGVFELDTESGELRRHGLKVRLPDQADAIRDLEIASRQATGHNSRMEAHLGYAYAVAGRARDARAVLKELEAHGKDQYVSWYGIAVIHDALGEKAPALAALQRAFDDRAVEFGLNDDDYAPFRTIASEPAYQAVIRKVGR